MNPYSPPKTQGSQHHHRVASRPISVWILLLFAVTIALSYSFGVARYIWVFTVHLNEASPSAWFVGIVWHLPVIGLSAVLTWAIIRRLHWARWAGLLAIVVFAAWQMLRQETVSFENDAERLGGSIAKWFLLPLLCSWWAYAFAFSAKAKRYFGRQSGDAPSA